MWTGLRRGLLPALLPLLIAAPLVAQTPAPTPHDEAVRLFHLGELHYAGNEFEAAAAAFARAYELEPNAVLSLNAALAYENAGKLQDALTWFARTIDASRDDEVRGQASRGRARIQAILDGIEQSRQMQPGRVNITSDPSGATVVVDGMRMGETPYENAISPGAHDVRVEMPGFKPFTQTVQIDPAGQVQLVVPFVAQAVAPAPEPAASGEHKVYWPAYVLLGVAAGSAALGAQFAGDAHDLADKLDTTALKRDPDAFEQTKADGQTAVDNSNAMYGVAATSVVAAAVYWIWFSTWGEPAEPRPVSLLLDRRGAAVRVSF